MSDRQERRNITIVTGTTDSLGHALSTGVLVGRKGWVWCERMGVIIPVHHDAYGTTIVHGWRDDPHNHDECDCPGPHAPLYSGPHSAGDQPIGTPNE